MLNCKMKGSKKVYNVKCKNKKSDTVKYNQDIL